MIAPHTPAPMWCSHDTALGTYGYPYPSHAEARLYRNGQLAHLSLSERERLFPIVAVAVTIQPRPVIELPNVHQAHLFPGERHAARPQP